MAEIVAPQCPPARDATFVTRYVRDFDVGVFKTVKKNSTTIKHTDNKSANIIDGCNVVLTPMIRVGDWHGEYGDMCLPLLHTKLFDTGHM